MSKKPTKTAALVPVQASAKSATVALLDTKKLVDMAGDHVRAYVANTEQEAYYGTERKLSAMRVGLLGVCLSREHGAWKEFIDSCAGIEGMSERTLKNFKAMATAFLEDQNLLAKKKLLEGGEEQLELWTREKDTLEGKAREWMGERSLTEIYESLPKGRTLPPGQGGNEEPGEDELRERALAEAAAMADEIQQWIATDGCAHVCGTRMRRLTPEEAEKEELSFSIGLLSTEHLEALITAMSNGLDTAKHHLASREGTTTTKKGKR